MPLNCLGFSGSNELSPDRKLDLVELQVDDGLLHLMSKSCWLLVVPGSRTTSSSSKFIKSASELIDAFPSWLDCRCLSINLVGISSKAFNRSFALLLFLTFVSMSLQSSSVIERPRLPAKSFNKLNAITPERRCYGRSLLTIMSFLQIDHLNRNGIGSM